jgi:hypothetical protein
MLNPMNIVHILFFNLLLLFSAQVLATDIQVSVDRNPVNVNESFQIIFTATQSPDSNPDFTPLQENFDILDQQHSSNASWINGRSSRTEQWVVTAMVKQAGEVLIPPVAFGSDLSKPLKLTVSASQHTPQNNDELFMEVTATPENPYVQSQVVYTLRLYRRLQLTQAKLDEPQIKDAVVEKLGEDSTYSTQLQGVDYWVTERKYAIFPQQSGSMTIAPLQLTAEVVSGRRPKFGGFFNQQSTETRRVTSKAITLNVQPVPASFKNLDWLSADSLQLSEEWSDKSLHSKVGEPITRTLRLTAKAATVGQLPELAGQSTLDGLKTYADQPLLKEDKQGDGLTALREEKIAYIPSKPGEYKLPAVEISWFNTKTQKLEKASLPSVTLHALADNNVVPPQPAAPASNTLQIENPAPVQITDNNELRLWQLLCGILATGWLLTLAYLFRKPRVPAKPVSPPTHTASSAPSGIEKALKQACQKNQAYTAKQLLLSWGKTLYDEESLGNIAKRCAAPLREEIERLNQHLYSGQQQFWNGEALWQEFSQHSEHQILKPAENEEDALEPLNKI